MAPSIKFSLLGDDTRINVDQPADVQYWSEMLNCSTGKLKQAITAVGPVLKNVKACVKKSYLRLIVINWVGRNIIHTKNKIVDYFFYIDYV